ncbi:MAG TPA: Mut7-C RNAse domain-containing protein, partial [Phototrophicaceae bacterium]|nr:Mut7-C RNAse domain-containing protein [Phototrophicaceae bacterium]
AFVLDQHLGRLAAYLRMMGFDTLYRNDYDDEELAQVSHDETRVLLTRDVGLLKRSLVIYGYYVRETNREKQLVEITHRFNLPALADPFKHCMKCNGLLTPVPKAAVLDRLPDGTAQYYDEFHRCQSCQRVYWKGPHFQKMQRLVEQMLSGD